MKCPDCGGVRLITSGTHSICADCHAVIKTDAQTVSMREVPIDVDGKTVKRLLAVNEADEKKRLDALKVVIA